MKFKDRKKRVSSFITNNKIFVIAVIIITVFLGIGFLNKDSENGKIAINGNLIEETIEEQEKDQIHWRFYWSDLIVLLGATGFCTYKIVQRNRKTKEDF